MATIIKLSVLQLSEKYKATDIVTDEDIQTYCQFAKNLNCRAIFAATVGVSGQKPLQSLFLTTTID